MFSRKFSSIEALYVGCEHVYTGFLAKVCTEGLPQGIELHTNEIIVDISIDKYTNFVTSLESTHFFEFFSRPS